MVERGERGGLGRHLGGASGRHSTALAGALYACMHTYAYMTCWGTVELGVVVDVADLEQHVVTQRAPVGGDAAEARAWYVGMVGMACGNEHVHVACMWAWHVHVGMVCGHGVRGGHGMGTVCWCVHVAWA